MRMLRKQQEKDNKEKEMNLFFYFHYFFHDNWLDIKPSWPLGQPWSRKF
jgi:hypothetical protein